MSFCPKCGYQNADNAIYCGRCGSAQSGHGGMPSSSPTVVVVGNQTQQAPVSNPGTIWLWLNIILTLFCCSILSIIGIIFSAMSISKYNNGLYNESRSNASTAKVMFIIGLILGVLTFIGFVIYVVFMGGITALTALLPFIADFGGGY